MLKRVSVTKSKLFLLFLIVPFLEPTILVEVPVSDMYDSVIRCWKIASFLITIVLYVLNGKITKFIIMVTLFHVWLLLPTIIHGGNLYAYLILFANVLGVCLLFELNMKDNLYTILRVCVIWVSLLIFVNFLLILIYPNGMLTRIHTTGMKAETHLLGFRNSFVMWMIPYVFILTMYTKLKHNKLTFFSYIMTALCFVSVVLVWSATGVFTCFFMMIYVFFVFQKRYERLITLNKVVFFGVASFFGLVVFRLQNLFEFIISDILNRSMTLSGRTEIWDIAAKAISSSPVIGYGIARDLRQGHVYWNNGYWYAHNLFVELLLLGGFVLLFIYLYFLFSVMRNINKTVEVNLKHLLLSFFFFFFLFNLTEGFGTRPLFWVVMLLGYHLPYIAGTYSINFRK